MYYLTYGITILYHLHHVDLAHYEIFCAKVGKGGINSLTICFFTYFTENLLLSKVLY